VGAKGGSETPPYFLLFGFGGGVDLGEEFGGLGLEVVDAACAADKHHAVRLTGNAMDVGCGFAHAAEEFVGNEAGLERVVGAGFGDDRSLGGRRLFGGGGVGVVVVFLGGDK